MQNLPWDIQENERIQGVTAQSYHSMEAYDRAAYWSRAVVLDRVWFEIGRANSLPFTMTLQSTMWAHYHL